MRNPAASSYIRYVTFFFFSSRRRHTRFDCDWSSDVCSSDLRGLELGADHGDALGTGQLEQLGRRLLSLRDQDARQLEAEERLERGAPRRGVEIGRASCRERV